MRAEGDKAVDENCCVDNSEMEALSASVRLQQAAQEDAFRVRLSDALRSLTNAAEIQVTAARILAESLGATRVIYTEVVANGEDVVVQGNYSNGVAELSGRYRLEDYRRNLTTDHQAGCTQVVTDIPNSPRYTDFQKVRYREIDIAAHIDVPLIKNDQFVALLAVHQSTPRQWTDAEVKRVEETAERTWAAVERARAEAALRESEAKYRSLFESIDEGFCILEVLFDEAGNPVDLRYLETNRVFEQQTGVAGATGKTSHEVIPNLEPFWVETYAEVVRTGESVRFENYVSGTDHWFSVYASRIGGAGSSRVAVVFNDITERKRAELALQRSEARLRAVAANLPNGAVFIVDHELRYQLAAGQALEDAGMTSEDLVGKTIWEALDPALAGSYEPYFRQALNGEPYSVEHHSHDRDYASHGTPMFDAEGEVEAVLAVSYDITDRKRIEAEREHLLQREQAAREIAERANQIKDEFLAVLSHELRSPLNPILGWTRLLQSGTLDSTQQRNALATIERNARLQTQMIEDLLDISRIMQGKLSLTVASINLTFIISAAVETVQLAFEAKNIQLTLDLVPEIAPVAGDAARLQQVVWNLLANAVKFTPYGGQVIIELRQCDHLAQIRVVDTGKGINPQFLPHVFEYFRQEDGSTTRKFGGLGLGLAIVRQIVEMHGGTVAAESQGENQGATFIVKLPLMGSRAWEVRNRANNADSSLPAAHSPLTGLRILLVDDEPDTRKLEAFLLEQNGATVIATASGLEALQALEQSVPDVLISDIGMAEMDGYTLMQQIRSRPSNQGGTIPAIALTAYATEVDQQRALRVGFHIHITKPVEPAVLVRAIESLLKQS